MGDAALREGRVSSRVIQGEQDAVNPAQQRHQGLRLVSLRTAPGQTQIDSHAAGRAHRTVAAGPRFRRNLRASASPKPTSFTASRPPALSEDAKRVQRQAFAGLLWSKQFYHFVVEEWLKGDPGPAAAAGQPSRRDAIRAGCICTIEDIISMPDKWEYPWYAAWDLAFHMIPFALVDPDFAKRQLSLFLREWYMHPNGQIPAYEWAFGDVNPPVHAWACWRVFQIDRKLTGHADYAFLESVFHKLLMNFTWWVNRKDSEGNNIFEGGFLGLDNIGVFDRSAPLPTGGYHRTIRRHQLDGDVLPQHAEDRAGAGGARSIRFTKISPASSSSISCTSRTP